MKQGLHITLCFIERGLLKTLLGPCYVISPRQKKEVIPKVLRHIIYSIRRLTLTGARVRGLCENSFLMECTLVGNTTLAVQSKTQVKRQSQHCLG